MESHALPGTIQVTERAHYRLQERFELRLRGKIEVKGKGPMSPYLLLRRRDGHEGLGSDRRLRALRDPEKEFVSP